MRFRGRSVDKESLEQDWQIKLYGGLLALVLVIGYATAFVLENRTKVNVHFVLFTASVSLIWLILLGVGLGVAGGILLSQVYRRRRGPRD